MSARHILQVVRKTPTWGFDLFLQNAIACDTAGHRITTVFLSGDADEHVASRYPGETVFLQLDHKHAFWRFRAMWSLLQLCRSNRFDLALVHHYKPSAIMAIVDRILPIGRLYMVNHNSGNLRRFSRRVNIGLLFSTRWIYVGVSEWIRQDLLADASAIRPENTRVLYNCLDIQETRSAQLPRAQSRNALHLAADVFVFGTVGRLDGCKNHTLLIDAFAAVAHEIPKSMLVIIGDGKYMSSLASQVSTHGLQDRVMLTGLIPNASNYLSAFDCFVFPSIREGFGLALLEAMCASLPTITSRGAALPEVVGDTGLQFPPDDIDGLKHQLTTMANMPAHEREEMGAAGFKRLSDNFSTQTYPDKLMSLFEI